MKKLIGIITVILFIVGIALLFYYAQKPIVVDLEKLANQTILYYGNTCPHCKELEEYIKTNKIEEKVTFTRKEVYADLNNSRELAAVAKSCNIIESNIGVPFLYAKGKCYTGNDEIIAFIKNNLDKEEEISSPSGEKK